MKSQANTVVNQLREAIRGCGKSMYVVSKGAGVDASVLGRFVRGERGISLATAARVCRYMGLTLRRDAVSESAPRSRRKLS